MRRRRRGAAFAEGVHAAALTFPLAGDVRELVLPAVFKTVCGALLRRPGWVRFPSIPASLPGNDSKDDSPSGESEWVQTEDYGQIPPVSQAHKSRRSPQS